MSQVIFDEGAKYIIEKGLPTTVYGLLSTKPCSGAGTLKVTDTLAGGVGEITGTGYARQSKKPGAPSGSGEGERATAIEEAVFKTEAHTNWENAKSIVWCTTNDNTGKALFAEDLNGGAARPLGEANVEEKVTSTFKL